MQDFRQLAIWQRAHALVLQIYSASNQLPSSENFGLTIHLRRSAVAIARNIAEGAGRDSDSEFAVELKKARAAGHELEYVLLLCRDLDFLPGHFHDELSSEVVEIRRMISGLVKRTTVPAATIETR